MKKPIRLVPVPQCPECLENMVLRRPKAGQKWEPFWGCSDFPNCRGTLQIGDDGLPIEDDGYRGETWTQDGDGDGLIPL